MTAVVRQRQSPDLFDLVDQVSPMFAAQSLISPRPIRVEERIEDGHYVIRAEMPGCDPQEDLTVTVADHTLIIDAERTEGWSEQTRSEFHYGFFRRALTLPSGVKDDDIKATYTDGILTVAVGLGEPSSQQAKQIPVQGSVAPANGYAVGPTSAPADYTRVRGSVPPANGFAVGLTLFAAITMMLVGVFQAVQGVVALLNDTFFVAGDNWGFSFSITTWGWVHLVLGIVVAAAGFFVLQGAMWARAAGVAVAATSSVLNFMWLPYYPAWSLLIIALDVFVIWALIAHGGDVAE